MNFNIKFIVLVVTLLILQIVWFNHILLFGYFRPIVYILPFLILTVNKDDNYQLILAFFIGLLIDLSLNTLGVFTATTVFITYFKKIFFLYTYKKFKPIEELNPIKLNFSHKILYYFSSILLSLILIYLFESFQISFVFYKLLNILINSFISLIIFVFIDYLFLSTE